MIDRQVMRTEVEVVEQFVDACDQSASSFTTLSAVNKPCCELGV